MQVPNVMAKNSTPASDVPLPAVSFQELDRMVETIIYIILFSFLALTGAIGWALSLDDRCVFESAKPASCSQFVTSTDVGFFILCAVQALVFLGFLLLPLRARTRRRYRVLFMASFLIIGFVAFVAFGRWALQLQLQAN